VADTVVTNGTDVAKRRGRPPKALAAAAAMIDATGASLAPQVDEQGRVLVIPKRNQQTFQVRIVGMTPLITHRFGEDAIAEIERSQQGQARDKKPPRDPEREFEQAQYVLERDAEGKPIRWGFPAAGIKLAMTIAGQREAGEKRTELMGRLSIPAEFLEIITPTPPIKRTDRVRLSGMSGVTSLAYRPEFSPWSMIVPVRFNANSISLDQVVNILDLAGSSVGIGDWRVDKKGVHGQFEVDYESIVQIS
jgi:hypothetical protein